MIDLRLSLLITRNKMDVICKACQDGGQKSKTYLGMSMTTCVYYPPYHDEDGKYHHHDGNKTTTSYSCSNGHSFVLQEPYSCWCGWAQEIK